VSQAEFTNCSGMYGGAIVLQVGSTLPRHCYIKAILLVPAAVLLQCACRQLCCGATAAKPRRMP
jgi:hypothetical protein